MAYFLGIDLGTTFFKAGLFDETGKLCGFSRQSLRKVSDEKICELPVSVFWDVLKTGVEDALKQAAVPACLIKTISYSSQTNSFILLDCAGTPLTPLILWPDKRAEGIKWTLPDDFMETTGLGIMPDHLFSIAKIVWFQKNHPELWKRTASILSISDYLTYKLTGQIISDFSTASMSGLLNIAEKDWSERLLATFHVKRQQLPQLVETGTEVGKLIESGAQLLSLSVDTRLFMGGADHHIAAVGAGILFNGYLSESTGTVIACVDYTSGEYIPHPGICMTPGLLPNSFFRMTFTENGASVLDWYQKKFAPTFSIPALLEMAALVETGKMEALPNANKYPGLSGFRQSDDLPYGHGYYIRAILESTAYSLSGLVAKLRPADANVKIVSVGGGNRSKLWLKIKSSILNRPFYTLQIAEAACMGTAILGIAGTKEYGDLEQITKQWAILSEI
jgi:sugar (pentulose or hexulose) kinase